MVEPADYSGAMSDESRDREAVPEVATSREFRTRARRPHERSRGPLSLVLVRWRDAWFDFEQPSSGWREEYLVHTVGFLVRESDEVVSVAQERLPGREGYRAITHIPRGVVESVTTLFTEESPGRREGDRILQPGQ